MRPRPGRRVIQALISSVRPGSHAFTAAASIRAVEKTLTRFPRGAFSPATAFGAGFALTIPDTTRIDAIPAEAPSAVRASRVRGAHGWLDFERLVRAASVFVRHVPLTRTRNAATVA